MQVDIKRISRKARRFSVRHKTTKPAKFSVCKSDHLGTVLLPNLGVNSPNSPTV